MAKSIKQLKKQTARRQTYLELYRKARAKGRLPQKFGTWLRTQRALKGVGGGRRAGRQAGWLSEGDAAAIEKMLRKKKR